MFMNCLPLQILYTINETEAKTVKKIRRAEVIKFDIKVENDKPAQFRAEMSIAFEIER